MGAGHRKSMVYVPRAGQFRGRRGGVRRELFPESNAPSRVMSVNVGEDPVELVEAVVADHQLALAAGRMLDRNLRAKLLRQFLLEPVYVRITRRIYLRLARGRLLHSPHERFG